MLAAAGLCLVRGGRRVLADADCALAPGEFTAICGPNGAGKSSLIAALAGLLAPTEGSVTLDGTALGVMRPRERARAIGFLPQQASAAWDISVETLVALGRLPWQAVPGRPAHAAAKEDRAATDAAIAAMELGELSARTVSTLSGGERARAMMARVLAGQPQWILADEPLASLDMGHVQAMAKLLVAQSRAGRGVVVVMHDLAMAMNHADRVIVIDEGRIVADAPPMEALSEDLVAAVWRVRARWHGTPGEMALAAS